MSVEETANVTGGRVSLQDVEPKGISCGGFFGLGKNIVEIGVEVGLRKAAGPLSG